MRFGAIAVVLGGLALSACGSSSSGGGPAPAPDPTDQPPPEGPLALAPGDVAELAVTEDGVAGAQLATPNGDERFVLVVASTRLDTDGAELDWSLDTSAAPPTAVAETVTGCSIPSEPWKAAQVAPEAPPTGTTSVTVGATRTVHAPVGNGFEDITVKAIAVGKTAVVWADTTVAHPATLDDAFVTQFLSDFDDHTLPRERSVFGVESDLDGDGHVNLVFTPLTYKTAVAFFTGCDLAKWQGCATSNAGEYLWLTPPNAIKPPYNTPNAIKEILAHELSHLIHFNRKVLRNKLTSWPDSGYAIEGVGGFAQDAIGPQAGNLYVTEAGLDGISDYSLADVTIDGKPYDTTRDGVLRGGSYLFVRWLYDRAGGDTVQPDGTIVGQGGVALLRALLDSPDSIAKTLPTATKSVMDDVAVDFYTTLAMSNRDEAGGVKPTNACFSYLPTVTDPITKTQRGADVFASFHGMAMKGVALAKGTSGKVRSGGVVYATAAATSGQAELDLTVKVDAKAKPRVRVGRLR